MFKKTDPLTKLIHRSLISALVGLASGLGLGLIIWGITSALSSGPDFGLPPIEMAAFLGMGAGTVIGAILGGVSALKD